MNVLHMQLSGGFGGIATMSREMCKYSQDQNIFVFLFEGGSIADEMKSDGIPVYVLNASHKSSKKAKYEYLNICRKHNINVLVSHTGCFMEFQIIYFLKKQIPSLKIFMYEHCDMGDAMGYGWKSFVNKILYKKCFSLAENGIAISKYVRETALKLTPGKEEKIKVIYNGVDLRKFQYINRDREEYLRIIYVGRIIPEKGCDILINAISKLPKKVRVKVIFVGDGTDMIKCKKMVNELKIQDKILFVGKSNNVLSYLNNADVFVHPARCSEGFGITLVEAMSTGLPCIAFERGAIPELITSGKEGLLRKKVDVSELAEMITLMYEKLCDGSIEIMSKEANLKAQMFDIKQTANKLHELYEGVLIK